MCRDVFVFTTLRKGCCSHLVEARDAAKHPETEKTKSYGHVTKVLKEDDLKNS